MKPRYCPVCGAKMIVEEREIVCRACGYSEILKKPKRVHLKPEEK